MVEKKTQARGELVDLMIKQNITDLSSIKVISSGLSLLTRNYQEISYDVIVIIIFLYDLGLP